MSNLISGEATYLAGPWLPCLQASAARKALASPVKRLRALFLKTRINSVRFCCCRLCPVHRVFMAC